MKTRNQIIEEILKQHSQQNPVTQVLTLRFALKNMQDALLFMLAKDLNISLDTEAVS